MYVATPEAKNPTLEETFPSDPFAAATRLPKVIGHIYSTSLLMLCLYFLTALINIVANIILADEQFVVIVSISFHAIPFVDFFIK